MKLKKALKGSISLFLAIIMLPLYTFAGVIVDGARISAAKNHVSCAGDLAINAALSEFDEDLLKMYGLFAVAEDDKTLTDSISRYFYNTIEKTDNLEATDSYTRSFLRSIGTWFQDNDQEYHNVVDLKVEDFSISKMSNSAITNPAVLKKQIVEFMKFRGPVNIGISLLTKLKCLSQLKKQTAAMEKKVAYDKEMDSVQKALVKAYEILKTTVEAVNRAVKYETNDTINSIKSTLGNMDAALWLKTMIKDKNKYHNVHISFGSNTDYQKVKEAVKEWATDYYTVAKHLLESTNYEPTIDPLYSNWYYYYYTLKKNTGATPEDFNKILSNINYINNATNYSWLLEAYALYSMFKFNDSSKTISLKRINQDNPAPADKDGKKEGDITKAQYERLMKYGKRLNFVFGNENSGKVFLNNITESLGLLADRLAQRAYDQWNYACNVFKTTKSELSNLENELDDVNKKAKALGLKSTEWLNAIDALAESDVKDSMKADHDNTTKGLSTNDIDELIRVTGETEKTVTEYLDALQSIKYNDKKLSNKYLDLEPGDVNLGIISKHNFDYISTQATKYAIKCLQIPELITKPISFKTLISDCKFAKYLERMGKQEEENQKDTPSKSEARKKRSEVKDLANQKTDEIAAVNDIKNTGFNSDKGLKDFYDAINALAESNSKAEAYTNESLGLSNKDDGGILKTVKNLLGTLENIGESIRNGVYVEEYITEMFSCYTTGMNNKPTTNLNNFDMKDLPYYRSEVEYILYGNDNPTTNVNYAKGTIFAIRFALNAVYAFTSPETTSQALSIATTIAGWTGFGVPIVQAIVLLAMAGAESTFDMIDLMEGRDVPIYKTQSTWTVSLTGVIKYVGKKAENGINRLREAIINKTDDVDGAIKDYVKETTDSIKTAVIGKVSSAVSALITSIIGSDNMSITKEEIRNQIIASLNKLKSDVSGRSGLSAEVTVKALNYLMNEKPDAIDIAVNRIYDAYCNVKNGIENATHTAKQIIDNLTGVLESKVIEYAESATNYLSGEIKDIVNKYGDKAVDKVDELIDDFTSKICGSEDGGGDLTGGAALTMNYKEYLKLFVLIAGIGAQDSMLTRCAHIMQINVFNAKGGNIDLSNAATMMQVSATVSVRTTFLNIPVKTVDEDGKQTVKLDYSRIGQGRHMITYQSAFGY